MPHPVSPPARPPAPLALPDDDEAREIPVGAVVQMSPDEAAELGAFEETALDEDEAWAANGDNDI